MKIFLILLLCCVNYSYAAVPIVNGHDDDRQNRYEHTVIHFMDSANSLLTQIQNTIDTGQQIAHLEALKNLEDYTKFACKTAGCSTADQKNIDKMINQINRDLTTQLTNARNKIDDSQKFVDNVGGIALLIAELADGKNPLEVSIKLQELAAKAQADLQNTMLQIQLLLTQQQEKQMLEEKVEKQVNQSIRSGIANANL